ncbi:MAG TPA: hypothetical protein VM925_13570 [Labilithrix sp.]|nr:hypothetical protein [Labilithrix sp.]
MSTLHPRRLAFALLLGLPAACGGASPPIQQRSDAPPPAKTPTTAVDAGATAVVASPP